VRLPFQDERFDVVTCRFSVHHMSDPAAGLAAMAAVLRPGGRLVIADFVEPEDAVEAARHDRLERLRGHEYVRIYTASRLEAMLTEAGCPVRDPAHGRRRTPREMDPREWMQSPNVAPENRAPLAELVAELELRGGIGYEVRRVDGGVRLVRTDVVLLGIKEGAKS